MTDQVGKSALNPPPATVVKRLLRQALKAALATLDRQSGSPYASLVTLATAADGAPLILISRLAVHTQNILADPRASLLIDATSAEGDPLAGGRISLSGCLSATVNETEKHRFLARHPHAEMYAAFSDFAFYRLTIERAHFVGGFGLIVDLEPPEILTDVRAAASLLDAESDILEHMNTDHADAIALYATHKIGVEQVPSDWRMSGIDPEGLDLIGPSGPLRIDFPTPIATPGDARKALAALAAQSRDRNLKASI